ncbi:MAG: HD domain-containing protein [Pseudohongiella sp.]|uniref:HD domain-containing protein n=1 Tax=Pseudohongiella sp. TaxID=1979412 RepID=UPI0034A0A597
MSDQQQASFKSFQESSQEDWQIIGKAFKGFAGELPTRVIKHLRLLEGDCGGFPVDRLEHCLQTATRAWEAGEDEEYVVVALLHDIGDTLGTYDHGEIAAAILKPFVSEANHWLLRHHQIFQGYDYFHHLGGDRNMRDKYRDSPYYEYTRHFCEVYDGKAFDPDYESRPLAFFIPMVERVMARPRKTIFNGIKDA